MHTFVIGEMGSCHDNDWERAVALIYAAKDAGADAVKAQYWSSAERLAERRSASSYLGVYQHYQIPVEWLTDMKAVCDGVEIEFMSTVYLPEDIPVIAPYVKRFKVASFEAQDADFIAAHDKYGKRIIISTGMTESSPRYYTDVDYLHCVSAYPCPIEQANLGIADWGLYAGYSDHTHDVLTGALAVAAGARILEVHFRLDDTDPANPDYATALSPGQLKDYIALVRKAEIMLGNGIKRPQPCEAEMSKYRVKQ